MNGMCTVWNHSHKCKVSKDDARWGCTLKAWTSLPCVRHQTPVRRSSYTTHNTQHLPKPTEFTTLTFQMTHLSCTWMITDPLDFVNEIRDRNSKSHSGQRKSASYCLHPLRPLTLTWDAIRHDLVEHLLGVFARISLSISIPVLLQRLSLQPIYSLLLK